jgi:hypothetical protein
VPLDPELREFVEREDRSVAGQIRHLVAEAVADARAVSWLLFRTIKGARSI